MTTCEKPGSGSDQCGEGIEKGQKISFTLASASSPSYVGARDLAFSSEAKKLGIEVTVVTKSLNYMYENYTNPGAPANTTAIQNQSIGRSPVGLSASGQVSSLMWWMATTG